MWNFLGLLWIVCGMYTVYYLSKEEMETKKYLDAKDVFMLICFFFAGAFGLAYVISQEGDKMVVFKKPAEPTVSTPSGPANPPQSIVTPPETPVTTKERSVLDG